MLYTILMCFFLFFFGGLCCCRGSLPPFTHTCTCLVVQVCFFFDCFGHQKKVIIFLSFVEPVFYPLPCPSFRFFLLWCLILLTSFFFFFLDHNTNMSYVYPPFHFRFKHTRTTHVRLIVYPSAAPARQKEEKRHFFRFA